MGEAIDKVRENQFNMFHRLDMKICVSKLAKVTGSNFMHRKPHYQAVSFVKFCFVSPTVEL